MSFKVLTRKSINVQELNQSKTQGETIFYKSQKFHHTQQNHYSHYQLRKNLDYHVLTGVLIFSSFDKINFYNAAKYEMVTQSLNDFSILGVSTNDSYLLMAGFGSQVCLLNLENEKEEIFNIVPEQDVIMNQADFIDNNQIIVSDNYNQIRIFSDQSFQDTKFYQKCHQPVNFCAYKNNLIVACLDDTAIPVFDIRKNQQVMLLKRHMENNFVTRFNPQNEHEVATAGEDSFCYVWDLRNIKCPLKQIRAKEGKFYNINYTDQGYLICQEDGKNIQIVDCKTQSSIQNIIIPGSCTGCAVVDEKMYLSPIWEQLNIIYFINFDTVQMDKSESSKLFELQNEIDLALVTVGIIEQSTYPFQKSILEQYQSLNQALKNIYRKSILMNEQAIVPKIPQAIKFCDASLGLQATIYNNQVQNSIPLSYQEIQKKQDVLKELHQKATDHPYLQEKKIRKK